MFKKILKISSASLLIAGVIVVIGLCIYSTTIKNIALNSKLTEYKNKEIRLENMQKTILVCYNLTPYEARYYSFIFDDFSQKYNIPWEAFPALVRIESNFNAGVMSKERAKGMTQVVEATGRSQAQKLGIPFNDGTLWNCVLNMVIGFDFFSEGYTEKIETMHGDSALKHAMKRYCGGPGYATINPDARLYVKEYKTTVWDEYQRVKYIYKGIMYDQLMSEKDTLQKNKIAEASIFWPLEKAFNIFKTKDERLSYSGKN